MTGWHPAAWDARSTAQHARRDYVLGERNHLAAYGIPDTDIAQRLGISLDGLQAAIRRDRKAREGHAS